LKYLETIFDELPNLAGRRPAPARRDHLDLDEDLFAPTAAPAAIVPRRMVDTPPLRDRTEIAVIDSRPWPTLEVPAKQGPSPLEKKAADQERELALRCTQVADLYDLQERQSAELQIAYTEIERLNTAFAELQETATQHAAKSADRKKINTALYQENAVLRTKLDKALDDAAEMSKQMLRVETMFNDRELVITSALEQADLLKAELAAANAEIGRLTTVIDEAEQLRQDDADRKTAIIDELNRKIESLFVDHGIQLKTRDKLAKRCDDIAKSAAALESANAEATSKLVAQAEHTAFLETVLRVERETAEAKIKELTEKLEDERLQRTATEQVSAAMRQEMAALLRQFATRRHLQDASQLQQVGHGHDAGAADLPRARQNAA
jgi:chromosome segregation ATPase